MHHTYADVAPMLPMQRRWRMMLLDARKDGSLHMKSTTIQLNRQQTTLVYAFLALRMKLVKFRIHTGIAALLVGLLYAASSQLTFDLPDVAMDSFMNGVLCAGACLAALSILILALLEQKAKSELRQADVPNEVIEYLSKTDWNTLKKESAKTDSGKSKENS
jgi:hypothetical protein